MFSVSSAYEVASNLREELRGNTGSSRGAERDSRTWKRTWALKIKAKLKHFVWRVYKGWIAVNSALNKRGIKVDEQSKRCGEGLEKIEHVSFHCRKSILIWKMSSVQWDGIQHLTESFPDWWDKLREARASEDFTARLEISVYTLWQIWKSRNSWLFEEKETEPLLIAQRALNEWNEFKPVHPQTNVPTQSISSEEGTQGWRCPESGMVRINVSSFRGASNGGTGIGLVMRHENGGLVLAKPSLLEATQSSLSAELESIRMGLQEAQGRGLKKVEMQIDEMNIVMWLQRQIRPIAEVMAIVDDI
ncbi:OLC1v1017559C1 [Oldenlandia corymbosa var. corymbosa]|uniref:OLC1v1017559C1 n=1 Tax=Oldenlandia corymbosa var. corymbosa TaxID=529605 RepID=A0AAV1E9N2_OLDCO|nr:OLC1v1017559C1 [Oldenlandia corymbosa var. corymbosa]